MVRDLHPEDIVITDDSGPISMAGTMGGLDTEIDENSTDLVIEAAHFSAVGTARMSRRHRLHSEASYRFERGVDRELPLRASAKAAAMLAPLGRGTIMPGCTHAQVAVQPVMITMAADYPDRVAGVVYGLDIVVRRLRQVGCATEHDRAEHALVVTPPSWRSDLTDPADLAEEVIRLEGYENIPVRLPRAFAGHGLTVRQRLRRAVGRAWPAPATSRCSPPRSSPRPTPTRSSCRPRTRAATCGPGQPAQRRRAAAADHAAARAVPRAQAQHRAGLRRRRAVRDGPGVPAPARRPGRRRPRCR